MAGLTPINTVAWLLLAGLIMLTMAISGDAAQIAPFHVSATLFEWLLLAAQCIWFGSLAYLGYVLLPVVEIDAHAEMFAIFLRRLTPFVIGAIGVFLVSTLLLSEITVNNPQQLLLDPYGRTLLVKLLLIVVLLLLSIYTIWRVRPKLRRQAVLLPVVDIELPARRARHSALEQTARTLTKLTSTFSFFAAATLVCTALMSFYAPPIVFPNVTYTNPPLENAVGNVQTKQVGNISVTLQVLPGKVGASNSVILILTDNTGNPITNAQVRLSTNMLVMDMGTAHATIGKGSPVYVATFNKAEAFSMAGVWDIEVSIQRPGQAAVRTAFQVTLAG
jgi:putative copper export protein